MSKLSCFSVIFCVALGGFAFSLVHRTDFAVYIAITIISVFAVLIYARINKREYGKTSKILVACGSVISSGISLTAAASLITMSTVMPYKSYPLYVLVTGGLALCFAISKKRGFGSTVCAVTVILSVVFLILLFLCLLNVRFSAVSIKVPEKKFAVPLAVLFVFDIMLAMRTLDINKKGILIAGCMTAGVYMSLLSLIAMSALSKTLFYEFNMPLVKMWQSTYIVSFLNSFEIVCISAFYTICAVKSGIVLRPAFDIISKKYAVLVITCVYAVSLILALNENLILLFCALALLLLILIPVFVRTGK